MHSTGHNKKTCLIVIDGWGCSGHSPLQADAIASAKTPVMSALQKKMPCCQLSAHGRAVGLPAGLMGNSEVGHLNLGAGRVVFQDIVRIDLALESGAMERENETLRSLFDACERGSKRIHLVGLVSDGGVHSHLRHLKALLQICKRRFAEDSDVKAFVHAITDGRDTAPRSAIQFVVDDLMSFLEGEEFARLGSICGRYYAMDRDQRWERTLAAFKMLTEAEGEHCDAESVKQTLLARYERDESDEFFKPIIVDKDSVIGKDDCIVFFNFRSDRMRQICQRFAQTPELTRNICTMTTYSADLPFPVLSPPQRMTNVLAEWLSVQALRQCHVAETEKYAHVTFFFNGGREESFPGEERVLIASPKVATYDLKPEMSVEAVAKAMAEAVQSGKFDFVMGNLAPPDMVGHTGKFEETVKAVEATDAAIGLVLDACKQANFTLFITSDHGNAEKMRCEEGNPHTAHTCAPVPFICCDEKVSIVTDSDGAALCDVAPTILNYMNIEIPPEMTGKSLI